MPHQMLTSLFRFHTSAIRRLLFLSCLTIYVLQIPALAQETTPLGEPFATWNNTADWVQEILERDRASTAFMKTMRSRLAEQRSAAFEFSEESNLRVRALQARLNALGPTPAEGVSEAEDLAARRSQLLREVVEANAPLGAANEAFERANVLIEALDRRIRDRQTAVLLTRYPSALIVHRWPESISEIAQWAGALSKDVWTAISDQNGRTVHSDNVPIAIAFALVGALLLFIFLPALVGKLDSIRQSQPNPKMQAWTALGAALVRVLLPGLAAAAIIFGWRLVDPATGSLQFLSGAGPEIAIDLVLAYWLGHLLFSPKFAPHRIIDLDDTAARHGYQIAIAIGIVSASEIVLDRLDFHGQFSPDTLALLTTPFMIAGGALIWALAAILTTARKRPSGDAAAPAQPSDDSAIGAQFLKYFCFALRVAGVAIPLAALAGYVRLSRDGFDASVQMIALLTIALVLFHAIVTGSYWLIGQSDPEQKDRKPLYPILVATLLTLALLPLLALVWGARTTDIAEIWRVMSEGIPLGDVRISADGILAFILVFSVGLLATRVLQATLRTTVLPRTRLDRGVRNAIVTGIGYVGITIAAVVAISAAGVNLSSFAIIAGALSVGIGFGLQTIASNFVSGIILLIERPIKEGDWIEVSGYSGHVRRISVRSTRIETFDRHDVIIPNSDLISGVVRNMTLNNATGRVIVPVTIAYGSDVKRAREILLAAAHDHPEILQHPAPHVLFVEMGDNGLAFELRGFLRAIDKLFTVRSDLMTSIYENLREAGISIPFPQRDVHVHTVY